MSTVREEFNKVLKAQSGQDDNFKEYNEKLNAATCYADLHAINAEMRTEQDSLPHGVYLFTKEDSTQFWAKYNELKEALPSGGFELTEEQKKAHEEYKEIIKSLSTVKELTLLNSTMYNDKKPGNKAELFKLSKEKIAILEEAA